MVRFLTVRKILNLQQSYLVVANFNPAGLPLTKRLINRRALIGEKLRPVRGNVQTIFQTNSKLAIDHDRRFVAKAHARLNRCLVAAHEVRPLVAVEPYAVAGAMRQSRSL